MLRYFLEIKALNISTILGSLTLNVSSALYLIVYIPQIIHNRKSLNIASLSLWLHFILYISFSFDLLYGFADNLPWQYKICAAVGLFLIIIQHIQLLKFYTKRHGLLFAKLGVVFLLLSLIFIYCLLKMMVANTFSPPSILILGTISSISGLIYCIPQMIKNKSLKSTQGVSEHFIYLSLLIASLDTVSAWCLGWGWPIKIESPMTTVFMIIILCQYKKYDNSSRSLSLSIAQALKEKKPSL